MPANDTPFSRTAALRSPATVAALDALTSYSAGNPDPRHPDHAETLRRLQYAYITASQADGSFYASQAAEMDGWAEKAEACALDYPAHAERYLAEADRHRKAAAEARAMVAEIVGGGLARAA